MKPEVVLIADAGPGIGWGHAVRQLALATALVGKGVRTLFVSRGPEALRLDWPCPVQREPGLNEQDFHPSEYERMVIDLPDWDGGGALFFDDYGTNRGARTVVDPHFGALDRGDPITPSFLGPRFAPLRHPFNDGWLKSEGRTGVFVYGVDAPKVPKEVPMRGVDSFKARHSAEAMGRSVCALVPPSMVALECLAIGTPVVLYVPGPRWQPIADAMEAAGVAKVWSGRADDHTLGCVLADDGMRRRMSEAGREAVDGRGAERLAEWLA